MSEQRQILTGIGDFIKGLIPDSFGFAVFIFKLNVLEGEDGGRVNYVSNCRREDIVDGISEWILTSSIKEPEDPTIDKDTKAPRFTLNASWLDDEEMWMVSNEDIILYADRSIREDQKELLKSWCEARLRDYELKFS